MNINKNILKRSDIIEIDIETSGICNLQCPLCLSRLQQFKKFFKIKYLDINIAKRILDTFINLDQVTIAGDASEPTLYPNLFELLEYLDNRKTIYVEIFTNGSTHVKDIKYWNELSKRMPDNSNLVFTICGTTQKLHEKYRVGSKLQDILDNQFIYKECRKKNKPNFPNDCMQYIYFEYNKNDNDKDIITLENKFTRHYRCNTNPIYERLLYEGFYIKNKQKNDICLESNLQAKYLIHIIKNKILNENISCHMYNIKQLRLDNFGKLYPCSFYKFFEKNSKNFVLKNGNFNYNKIFNKQCNFCYECTEYMTNFFNKINCKQSFMC